MESRSSSVRMSSLAVVQLDGPAQMLDRLVGLSGPCLEAGGVEGRHGVVRPLLDDDQLLGGGGLVVTSL